MQPLRVVATPHLEPYFGQCSYDIRHWQPSKTTVICKDFGLNFEFYTLVSAYLNRPLDVDIVDYGKF